MSRGMWLGSLLVSMFLVAAAGFGIVSAGQPDDIGTTDIARTTQAATITRAAQGNDASDETASAPDSVEDDTRAAAAPAVPSASRSLASASQAGSQVSVPVRLRVEDVALDAPLDATGVRDDGLMQIPDDGDRAGWYRYGPAPGVGQGSVVLAGHVDTKEGLGAMAALRDVNLGALVSFDMADGTKATYEFIGRETIAKDDLPTAEIFDRSGPERLTLITCGGPWRSEASSYRDNVVVVATPVD